MLGKKVAIDLGASRVRVMVKGEGTVADEPSLVAVADNGWETLGVGGDAPLRSAARGGHLVSPVDAGRVTDVAAVEALLSQLFIRAVGRQRVFKPDVMVAVPSGLSSEDRHLVLDILCRAGSRTSYLLDVPIAAAIGAGIEVAGRDGTLIVDVGGGTCDIAVLAREGCISGAMVVRGGRFLDAALAARVKVVHGVRILPSAAEQLKRELASAIPLHEERRLVVPCVDDNSTAGTVEISSDLVAGAIQPWLDGLAAAVAAVLEDTPARLLDHLRVNVGLLTGAGAWLRGLDRHLQSSCGIPFRLAAEPEGCTMRGCASALDNLDLLKRNFLYIH